MKSTRKGLYTPKTSRKGWKTIAKENSTGAFEAASVSYPLLSYPVLSKRISEGRSRRRAAEGDSVAER